MPNLMDYFLWRGDLSLAVSPWNDIDSLAMAMLSYNVLSCPAAASHQGITLKSMALQLDLMERTGNTYFEQWRAALYAMANSRRYSHMVIHDYVDVLDPERNLQFSVLAADLEDGTMFLAFRGTDSTLTGWHEDFDMSYSCPVPAQSEALAYLQRVGGSSNRALRLSGHSKGGNLAAYAATMAPAQLQDKILSICSFDGPGLTEELLSGEGYGRIRSKLVSVIPQSSVVGLLMGYHPDYQVVHSTKTGLYQHDAMTWQLNGPAFQLEKDVDTGSALFSQGLHRWLKTSPREEREAFVSAVFDLLGATDARTLGDITGHKAQSVAAITSAMLTMSPEAKKCITDILGSMLGSASSTLLEYLQKRSEEVIDNLPLPRRKTEGPDVLDSLQGFLD